MISAIEGFMIDLCLHFLAARFHIVCIVTHDGKEWSRTALRGSKTTVASATTVVRALRDVAADLEAQAENARTIDAIERGENVT